MGEVAQSSRPYYKGQAPAVPVPTIQVGETACIENGGTWPLPLINRTFPFGIDSRCWLPANVVETTSTGGDESAGEAIDSGTSGSNAIGGDQVGGSSTSTGSTTSSAIGGDVVSGSSDSTSTISSTSIGGDVVGGSADATSSTSSTGDGGDQVGGSADATSSTSSTGDGGDQVGGSADATRSTSSTGDGGGQVGGSADATRSTSSTGDGGDQVGGSSDSSGGSTADGTGGDVVDGRSDDYQSLNTSSQGGDQVGGRSDDDIQVNTSSQGGDQVGGRSDDDIQVNTSSQGGDQVGGRSDDDIQVNTSSQGGDVVGGANTASNQNLASGGQVGTKSSYKASSRKLPGGSFLADTVYINDDGIKANANTITGSAPETIGTGYLRLFTAPTTVDKTKVIGDFTEATFAGYAAIHLVAGTWNAATVTAHLASAAYSVANTFTRSSTGSPQSCYGWFITDSGKTKVYACALFGAGPYVVTNLNDSITVNLILTDQSLN